MFHDKIDKTRAAIHVGTVGDCLFRGGYTSFRTGEKHVVTLHRHALINNQPFAVLYDKTDGMFELYQTSVERPGMSFVRAVTADQLNALEGRFGVFQDPDL